MEVAGREDRKQDYCDRLADPVLAERLRRFSAVLLTGPRGCGKTTTAMRQVAQVVRPPQLSHLRDKNGRHEVDLIADFGRKGVVAIEFKAKSAPSPSDAAHLNWLRGELGGEFLGGAVVHAGPSLYQLAERIIAVPLCAAWA